ncbi:peptide-methionine (S)-S-oxide reductase MsrA [Aquimarina intermedia]|uniref:Peptide methionine sulfoxide reductase MsrA n=1 Tax=Aquimarina intermedia TaxID=350814 RepID=A0A5S5C6D4_9FLAO|nr:peptide-methionine (S)-S-oxide reductase MsrA [Aquimarina intermedia]TYP74975.1 peptide-methionine (S)-S-oxide reductase [Aquimarina intermedia]
MKVENLETAVLAGGCFWCTEAVFQRLEGVKSVLSGYTGGTIKNPAYREITTGRTGHAEAIQIHFDSNIFTFKELLEVFFYTHNPTTLNQQGADKGTQYRSAIFYVDNSQKEIAEELIKKLNGDHVFNERIVTEVTVLGPFYTAEKEHHDYYNKHETQRYCQLVIDPKLATLKNTFESKLKKEVKNVN